MNEAMSTAAERRMEVLLEELAGDGPHPDLAARIAAGAAAQGAHRQAQRRFWLRAAAVLFASAVVTGVAVWHRHDAANVPAAAPQDPEKKAQEPKKQDPAPAPAVDPAIAKLLRDLELPARYDGAVAGLKPFGEAAVAALDRAIAAENARQRTEVLQALQGARMTLQMAGAKAKLGIPDAPCTLICDYSNNSVTFVDAKGKDLWQAENIFGAWDAQLLPDGNVLVTMFSTSTVQILSPKGKVVWEYDALKNPYRASLLANGNILIADTFGGRVIEVTRDKQVVWESKNVRPFDASRLPHGNTLIADVVQDRVLEVDPKGDIVWQVPGMNNVHCAERLANGNTLITLRAKCAVVEVDPNGKPVWMLDGLGSPSAAHRLANGNTLVSENSQVREFAADKKVVWKKDVTWAVQARRY